MPIVGPRGFYPGGKEEEEETPAEKAARVSRAAERVRAKQVEKSLAESRAAEQVRARKKPKEPKKPKEAKEPPRSGTEMLESRPPPERPRRIPKAELREQVGPSRYAQMAAAELGVGPVPRYTGFGKKKAKEFGTGYLSSFEAWLRAPSPDWPSIMLGYGRKAIPHPVEKWVSEKVPGAKWISERFVPGEKQAERELEYMKERPAYAVGAAVGETTQAIAFTELAKFAKPKITNLFKKTKLPKLGEAGTAPKTVLREMGEEEYKGILKEQKAWLKALSKKFPETSEWALERAAKRGVTEAVSPEELALKRFAQRQAKPLVVSPGALKGRPMKVKKEKPLIREMGEEEKAAWAEEEEEWIKAFQKSRQKARAEAQDLMPKVTQRQRVKTKVKQKQKLFLKLKQKAVPKLALKQKTKVTQKQKQKVVPKLTQKQVLKEFQLDLAIPHPTLRETPRVKGRPDRPQVPEVGRGPTPEPTFPEPSEPSKKIPIPAFFKMKPKKGKKKKWLLEEFELEKEFRRRKFDLGSMLKGLEDYEI